MHNSFVICMNLIYFRKVTSLMTNYATKILDQKRSIVFSKNYCVRKKLAIDIFAVRSTIVGHFDIEIT